MPTSSPSKCRFGDFSCIFSPKLLYIISSPDERVELRHWPEPFLTMTRTDLEGRSSEATQPPSGLQSLLLRRLGGSKGTVWQCCNVPHLDNTLSTSHIVRVTIPGPKISSRCCSFVRCRLFEHSCLNIGCLDKSSGTSRKFSSSPMIYSPLLTWVSLSALLLWKWLQNLNVWLWPFSSFCVPARHLHVGLPASHTQVQNQMSIHHCHPVCATKSPLS